MSIMNDIIRERRKELGLTQKELADILSISDKTVSRWESGNQIPDAILLPDLAEALQISLNDLYGLAKSDDKPASDLIISKTPHKFYGALSLAYKISMALGLVLFLFGSMLMIHINTVYLMSATGNIWQNGNVFMFLGAGLCFVSQIAFMSLSRQKNFSFDKSEIMYGGICALGILGVLQIVFPICVTVHITYVYELIVGLIVAAVTVMMIFQKRTLRSYEVKVGKSITIASIAVVALCILTMLGVFIYLNFFSEKSRLDEIFVMFGVMGQKETFGYRVLQCSFYAVQIPLVSSVLMNFIHLLIKSNKIKNN